MGTPEIKRSPKCTTFEEYIDYAESTRGFLCDENGTPYTVEEFEKIISDIREMWVTFEKDPFYFSDHMFNLALRDLPEHRLLKKKFKSFLIYYRDSKKRLTREPTAVIGSSVVELLRGNVRGVVSEDAFNMNVDTETRLKLNRIELLKLEFATVEVLTRSIVNDSTLCSKNGEGKLYTPEKRQMLADRLAKTFEDYIHDPFPLNGNHVLEMAARFPRHHGVRDHFGIILSSLSEKLFPEKQEEKVAKVARA